MGLSSLETRPRGGKAAWGILFALAMFLNLHEKCKFCYEPQVCRQPIPSTESFFLLYKLTELAVRDIPTICWKL